MRTSSTMSFYIGRQFLGSVLVMLTVFLVLIYLIDSIELLRRAASRPDVTFGTVAKMAFLKLPHMSQEVLPFGVLFGGMAAFWRLTRNHELVVTRAAGMSAWQFLLPAILLAALLGGVKIAALNPLASAMLARYQRLEAVHFKGQDSALSIAAGGLWLRQAGPEGQSVIHADRVIQHRAEVELYDVNVFVFRGQDEFDYRLDADFARLENGFWRLQRVLRSAPEQVSREIPELLLSTDLTLNKIQESFSPPETLSFWALRGFIQTLEKAGFSAVRHRLHWHSLLATPLLMAAMVLIGATFTLRHNRRGSSMVVIAGGVAAGFLLYFFSDVVYALGLSDSIPVVLAAWTPSGVSTLLGSAMLFHLEDG